MTGPLESQLLGQTEHAHVSFWHALTDRLTLDLYWEYETVSDPQLSPDSAQIIYTRK